MMNASSPFSRGAGPFRSSNDRRLEDPTRVAPAWSIGGNRADPFSRRALLKAGAAGLVGLGLPLAAPPRARAQAGSPVLFSGTNGPNLAMFHISITSGPTFNPSTGQVCVTGRNNNSFPVVLVWDVFNAPKANDFLNGGFASDFGQGQTLMSIATCTVPAGQPFTCCTRVPNACFQADLGNFQADLGAFQADLAVQNPGLLGTPVLVNSANSIAAILVGSKSGQCPSCCIRMTGGGRIGTIFTLSGVQVSTSEGFQLRTGPSAHSNLEVNFGGTTPGSGMNNFHLGPPDGFSNLMCGTTSCPGGGGGGQPLNQPNTIFGFVTGTLNGRPATAFINFVDCGEPGTNDTREIVIWGSTDTSGTPVIFANGTIQNGNNQAHTC